MIPSVWRAKTPSNHSLLPSMCRQACALQSQPAFPEQSNKRYPFYQQTLTHFPLASTSRSPTAGPDPPEQKMLPALALVPTSIWGEQGWKHITFHAAAAHSIPRLCQGARHTVGASLASSQRENSHSIKSKLRAKITEHHQATGTFRTGWSRSSGRRSRWLFTSESLRLGENPDRISLPEHTSL